MEQNNLVYRTNIIESLLPNGVPNFDFILNSGMPLAVLKKEVGLSDTIKIVALMLANFCGSFNVSKNMTANQITDYAITLVEENQYGTEDNPSLRIEDFALFFECAKRGIYGKPFDYIDATLIQEWLFSFKVERYNTIIRQHEARKSMQPEPPKTKEDFEKQQRFFELMKTLKEKINSYHNKIEIETSLRKEQEQKRLKEISNNRAKSYWGEDWENVKKKIENEKIEEIQRSRPKEDADKPESNI